MLNLTRKEGESIIINGHIRVVISRISGSYVKVSIEAPDDVKILREELVENDQNNSLESLDLHA